MTAASANLSQVLRELSKHPIPSVLRIEACAQEAARLERMTSDLEQSVRNFIALVQEPGIMDVDEWKAWSRRVVFDARATLEKLNGK